MCITYLVIEFRPYTLYRLDFKGPFMRTNDQAFVNANDLISDAYMCDGRRKMINRALEPIQCEIVIRPAYRLTDHKKTADRVIKNNKAGRKRTVVNDHNFESGSLGWVCKSYGVLLIVRKR